MRTTVVLLALALCARSEELPEAPGVTVEVAAERTEFAIGDPILLDVVYRNEGKEEFEVSEPHVLRFYDPFVVHDSAGARVPNPFGDIDNMSYDGPVSSHKLLPGSTVILRKYVNESAGFEKPGEYVVTAQHGHFGGISGRRDGTIRGFRCPRKPLKITILPAPEKKVRDATVADLMALWRDPKLREREPYARYRPYITESNGSTDALRLLAFRRDQELLPFWLEGIEVTGKRTRFRSAFAPEALAGLPDRAAVLMAMEDRLARSVDANVLTTYVLLAVPDGSENSFARRKEIRDRYESK